MLDLACVRTRTPARARAERLAASAFIVRGAGRVLWRRRRGARSGEGCAPPTCAYARGRAAHCNRAERESISACVRTRRVQQSANWNQKVVRSANIRDQQSRDRIVTRSYAGAPHTRVVQKSANRNGIETLRKTSAPARPPLPPPTRPAECESKRDRNVTARRPSPVEPDTRGHVHVRANVRARACTCGSGQQDRGPARLPAFPRLPPPLGPR